jgi:predicted DNA-binding transcriptional regulator AlpA
MLKSPHSDKARLPEKLAYSVRELVEATGVSRSAIYLEIKSRRLLTLKVGKRRIIIKEQAVAWLNALQSRSDAA